MSIGLFLRRELIASVRGARAFADRRNAGLLMAAIVAGGFVLWDWVGWDRASVGGNYWFALAMFGMMVAGQACLTVMFLVPEVGAAIALERERKSLDALLATRLGSAEIVLGTMAAALFRYANCLAATLPIVALMMFLGGVDRSWTILAGGTLASLAFLVAAASVAASVGARTGSRAVTLATGVLMLGFVFPSLYVVLRPHIWPGAPGWLTSIVVAMTDASPLGLMSNLVGAIPRPGGVVGAVSRMMAWQIGIGAAMVVWAIVRLRPASRAVYDVEGRITRLRMLRAALRRAPRRPPCGDDPVLWYEVYSTRGVGPIQRFVDRLMRVVWFVALAVGTYWFAAPAFSELLERGYGPSREAFTPPELNPLVRFLVSTTYSNLALGPAPGQARLEFNIMIRQLTSLFALGYVMGIFGAAIEGVKGERKRDTWLGLIATPLTGWEILRGKMLGAIARTRQAVFLMVGLWTIGLLAGAVHPLGFLAELAFLAASGWFYAAQGHVIALKEVDPERRGFDAISPLQILPAILTMIFLTAGPVALGWASLLTYEDVHAAIHAGPFPAFGEAKIKAYMGARGVVAACLAGMSVLAIAAVLLTRSNARGFDKAVGRPMRPDAASHS